MFRLRSWLSLFLLVLLISLAAFYQPLTSGLAIWIHSTHRWIPSRIPFPASLWTSSFLNPDGTSVITRVGNDLVYCDSTGSAGISGSVCQISESVQVPHTSLIPTTDGAEIVLWRDDGFELLRPQSFRPLNIMVKTKSGRLCSLAVSPDGKCIATGHVEGVVRFWDSRTGEPTNAISAGDKRLSTLQFSPDGKLLLAGQRGAAYRVLNIKTKETIWGTPIGGALGHCLFHPDGSLWTAQLGGSEVTVFEIPKGEFLKRIPLEDHSRCDLLSMDPTGKRVAIAGNDGSCIVLETSTERRMTFHFRRPNPVEISLALQGRRLVGRWEDGYWESWLLPVDKQFYPERPTLECVNPWGGRCRTKTAASRDRVLVLGKRPFQLDLSSNQPELQAEPFIAQIKSPGTMVLDDSGRLIMSPDDSSGLLIYELRPTPRVVRQREAFDRRSASLAVKQGEGGIYAGTFDGVVVRHHPVDDKILSEWRLHYGPVLSISLGQSQPVALSVGGDGVVILWDAYSGKTLKTWRECPGDVMEVELSPDGHFAAAILNGARVKIWDTRSGETWAEVTDVDAKTAFATFSPDSGSILLWSDRSLQLWDLDRRIVKARVGIEEAPIRAGFDSTGGRVWVAYRERAEWRDLALNPIGVNVSATEDAQGEQGLDRLKAKEPTDPRFAVPSSFVNVDSANWQKGKRPPKD